MLARRLPTILPPMFDGFLAFIKQPTEHRD
jgi:hypothetical protein